MSSQTDLPNVRHMRQEEFTEESATQACDKAMNTTLVNMCADIGFDTSPYRTDCIADALVSLLHCQFELGILCNTNRKVFALSVALRI